MSQSEMGQALGGVKQGAYSNYENDTRPLPAGMLAKAKDLFRERNGAEWGGAPAFPAHATPGFPEKQIVRATELSYKILGALTLTPTKMGWLIATIAEMLVRGRAEEEILAEAAPMAKALAYSGSSHPPAENQIPQPGAPSPK